MTSKRPLSDSSLAGVSSSNPSHQVKKVKAGVSGQDSLSINIDPIHADLRTALHIKNALDSIRSLHELGYCPTKDQKFRKYFGVRDDDTEQNEEEVKCRSRDLANQVILGELKTLSEDIKSLSTSYACGIFDCYFDLHITRPGCEYNGRIVDYREEIDKLLPDWFAHSAISGYGDMQSLETKVDSEVRNAREIPASEFEVKPELLKKIQATWAKHFLPRKVQAMPYKIHLYGPGGHFKSHRDTPETGLVGTFLIGLGDTSSTSEGNFHIGDKTLRAERETWVAFHPDIPHEITKLEDGYRAVLAFKIFRVQTKEPDLLPTQVEGRVKTILDQIPAPFGLLTSHQYSMGTTSLNGFDTVLLAYARSRNNTQAHMIPVVINFSGEAFCDPSDGESYTQSRVYPFTRAHVDILLRRNVDQATEEVQWLDKRSGIPFYAWDMASLEIWKEDHPDGVNYTGNEADSQREDSVYLSHAILFLPETPNDPPELDVKELSE